MTILSISYFVLTQANKHAALPRRGRRRVFEIGSRAIYSAG